MKTKTLFTVAIIAFATTTLLANPAAAVTKCVALGASTTCTGTGGYNSVDWSATCTTGGVSTNIQGIAFCSNKGGSTFSKSSTITMSSTVTENSKCWCKMLSPAVSSWVVADTPPSAGDCADTCASFCATYVGNTSAFRSALFSDLSD